MWATLRLSGLAKARSDLKQFDEAWRCIGEAISTAEETLERWWLAEVYRTAGDIALLISTGPHGTKAEAYFKRALDTARLQQAKSLELRAAISLARL